MPSPTRPPEPRDCIIRLRLADGPLVPSVDCPGAVNEVPICDDGVGPSDERSDHSSAHPGADLEPTEAAGVPGVGTFDYPGPSSLRRGAPGAPPVALLVVPGGPGLGQLLWA
mgnify:CR=1 FL=1